MLPKSPTCRRSIESYLSPCSLPKQTLEDITRAKEGIIP